MKRLLSIAVSLLILAVIYWKIDFPALGQVFRQADGGFLALSLGMVVPLTLATAWRFQQLAPRREGLAFAECVRLILLACVLNMVLPSKMGDIAKAYFMRERGHLEGGLALALVVLEKACDMRALLAWCVFGLALFPQKGAFFWSMTAGVAAGLLLGLTALRSRRVAGFCFGTVSRLLPGKRQAGLQTLAASWEEMQDYFWSDAARVSKVALTSVGIWFLHLCQIWLFILALRGSAPFLANLALAPLTILAGLLPLTFAGVGTRDAAILALYGPYLAPATAAALGLLCTTRYLLPALAGLPLLPRYALPEPVSG